MISPSSSSGRSPRPDGSIPFACPSSCSYPAARGRASSSSVHCSSGEDSPADPQSVTGPLMNGTSRAARSVQGARRSRHSGSVHPLGLQTGTEQGVADPTWNRTSARTSCTDGGDEYCRLRAATCSRRRTKPSHELGEPFTPRSGRTSRRCFASPGGGGTCRRSRSMPVRVSAAVSGGGSRVSRAG
uniref:Uncharacterized protein n=1 Tax=Rhodococcus sp. NS1 TaxID=402236 RepID=A0A097SR09_9NOCA|nr:hypothetical protein LRS1606.527 [Rhodococcus sp. NS1]